MTEQTDLTAALNDFASTQGLDLIGIADLAGLIPLDGPQGGALAGYDKAVSFALAVNPEIMIAVKDGPNQVYAEEYQRLNDRINDLSARIADMIRSAGGRAWPTPASIRSDPETIRGDFQHKTAATRAGLGWIGRHCQLVTREFGSWIRLGTILTDAPLPCDKPMDRSFCGQCTTCVEACPARALTGNLWTPGLPRQEILDAWACDKFKKDNYMQFHNGHNCGICSAVCPWEVKFYNRVGLSG